MAQVRTPLPVYTTGTISGNAGSAVITGTNTNFTTTDGSGNVINSIQGGDVFISAQGPIPIKSVDSVTQITLEVPLVNSIAAGSSYRIIKYQPNLTGGVTSALIALLNQGSSGTPLISSTVDNGAGRGTIRISSTGTIQLAVGPTGTADAALLVALDISEAGFVSFPNTIDAYRYCKAINANATLVAALSSGVLPVDAMVSYAQGQSGNSPGSNTMRAATTNIPAPSGGDFETLVLSPWLTSLGYTASSSPTTNAGLIATLRAAALTFSS